MNPSDAGQWIGDWARAGGSGRPESYQHPWAIQRGLPVILTCRCLAA